MSTGYTQGVADGTVTSFAQFAMNCARAFGACVDLRDETGGGEKIPQSFEPHDYHKTRGAEESEKLAALRKMTSEEVEKTMRAAYEAQLAAAHARRAEKKEKRIRFLEMRDQVKLWNPPTAHHTNLKTFMLEQLDQSIEFDCKESEYDADPELPNAEEWLADSVKDLIRSIGYHAEEYAKEVARTNDRNAWLSNLRESLKAP